MNPDPTISPDQPSDVATPAPRPSISATDRLSTIYRHPGPYTTVYLATRPLLPGHEADTLQRWQALRADLETQCAPLGALAAIEARLALPSPEDTAAVAVIAAADGTTVVDHGLEPPAHDYGVVDTLPYAGPLLEWQQRRISHLVVAVDHSGADIALFGLDHYQRFDTVEGAEDELADQIIGRQREIGAELIVLAGARPDTGPLVDRLRRRVPVTCRVVTESVDLTSDDLADATVRHVSDTAARSTVRLLRERRFLATHQAAVDGTTETVRALAAGSADVLLIHDDPTDQRRCWIGTEPRRLSLEPTAGCRQQARLVDAAIWSAIGQGIAIHIIPTTGPTGPDDNTAALTHDVDSDPGLEQPRAAW